MPRPLVPEGVLKKVPPLRAHEHDHPDDVPVAFKVFDPAGAYTYYATEAVAHVRPHVTPETIATVSLKDYLESQQSCVLVDIELFGLGVLFEAELGSASLIDMVRVRNRFGMPLERDRFLEPGFSLGDAMRYHGLTVKPKEGAA